MKNKILLATLFSVVLALAIVGLTTEKTMAKGGFDDQFWMETGESLGLAVPKTVYCSGVTIFGQAPPATPQTAIDCASISTGACTPYSPC